MCQKNKLGLSALLLLFNCMACESFNPAYFNTAPLLGVVYDGTSLGVQGFKITLDDTVCVYTDINGKFIVPELSKGAHRLKAEKQSYETLAFSFDFSSRTEILYLSSRSSKDYLGLAEDAVKKGFYDKAKKYIQQSLALADQSIFAQFLEALIDIHVKDFVSAYRNILKLLKSDLHETAIYLLALDLAELSPEYREHLLAEIKKIPGIRQNSRISEALNNFTQGETDK